MVVDYHEKQQVTIKTPKLRMDDIKKKKKIEFYRVRIIFSNRISNFSL